MVRFIHASKTQQTQNLGYFTLRGSAKQSEAAIALYNLLVQDEGASDIIRLRQVKHTLYDALLQSAISSDEAIVCPTDQMLFLASILPDGRYCLPTQLMGLGTSLTLCFRCIFMHAARLHIQGIDQYLPWNDGPTSSGPGSGDENSSSSSGEDDDDSDEEDEGSDDMTESEDETEQNTEIETTAAGRSSGALIHFLLDPTTDLLRSRSRTRQFCCDCTRTPFDRCGQHGRGSSQVHPYSHDCSMNFSNVGRS